MPVTFPAHQGLIAWAKLRWPARLDGTALCIGAASPDLAYPLGDWLHRQSHTAIGMAVWAVPFTLVAATLTRRRAAAGIFANLPDLGGLRLRSYRVLVTRRPPAAVTVLSAVVGVASHVLIDAFTHDGRWGAELLGLDVEVFTLPVRGRFTLARVGQYTGHVFGSLAFVVQLAWIARRGRLESWYGADEVTRARAVRAGRGERTVFWVTLAAVAVLAVPSARALDRSPLFLGITMTTCALLALGCVVPSARRPV